MKALTRVPKALRREYEDVGKGGWRFKQGHTKVIARAHGGANKVLVQRDLQVVDAMRGAWECQ